MTKSKTYYIQNGYVGNAVLWWRHNGQGYTTDIEQAGKFSEAFAKSQCKDRPGEDMAWLCSHVDSNINARKTIIDSQHLDVKFRIVHKRRVKPFSIIKKQQHE